jgi:hypothetical protein
MSNAVKNPICFIAENALTRLRKLDQQPHPSHVTRILSSGDRRTRMRLEDITTEESLFQPRGGISKDHVETLRKAKRGAKDLDPVLVIQIGPETILLDGHHRMEVYKEGQRRNPKKDVTIPVVFYAGTLEEALDEAGEENTKARLPMSARERQDYAWRRTVLGIGSIAQVARVSGVSARTVTTMRQVRDQIASGEGLPKPMKPGAFGTWGEARMAVRGDVQGTTEDYDDAMTRKAEVIAGELRKRYGNAFTKSPVMTAKLIEIMFQDRTTEVLRELREIVEGDPEEDEEETEIVF